MLFDLRFALRQLKKSPAFTFIAVFTLALGIGAGTAIFSVLHSVLLEPLPYDDADRLVWVFETVDSGSPNLVSGGAFKDWRDASTSFSHLAISEETRQNLTGAGAPIQVSGLRVSHDYLPALGIEPRLGRGFPESSDQPGGDAQQILLSHDFWQRQFGGERDVVGETLSLDGTPHVILGVLPPGALMDDKAQFVVPLVIDGDPADWTRSGHWKHVLGRLADGVSLDSAQTELRGIKERLAADYPVFKKDWSVAVVSLKTPFASRVKPKLFLLSGSVFLVLLIACVNVSNLLLARGQSRAREMAIRAALGAKKVRIVRQVLVESLVLALAGCALGLSFALFGIDALVKLFAGQVPNLLQPELNLEILAFSVVMTCGCALLFGLLPALRAGRTDPNRDLKQTERGSVDASGRRSQNLLVAAEFALTLTLLVGAGLFLRSFAQMLHTDPGFDTAQKIAFDLTLPDGKYPEPADRFRQIEELTRRVSDLPGVEAVGASSSLPLSGQGRTELIGRADSGEGPDYLSICEFVSGDYFSALGVDLLRGRGFLPTDQDVDGPKAMVIDQRVASDLFGGIDAVGRSVRMFGDEWQVVGVAEPVRHHLAATHPQPKIYLPQAYSTRETSLIVRTSVPPTAMAGTLRETVLAADPDQPVTNVRTLGEAFAGSLASERAALLLLVAFAGVAVCLACVGIYGVVSYAVGLRSRELSIRASLGARRGDIRALVLRDGLRPASFGIAIGVLMVFAVARWAGSLLFEVSPRDPGVYVGSVLLLALLAVASILLPARRAARSDPMEALRAE